MNSSTADPVIDENELIMQRRSKLKAWRDAGEAYPNGFAPDAFAADIHAQYGEQDNDILQAKPIPVAVAGRIMLRRVMGKAGFIQLQDASGRIQLYLRGNDLAEGVYDSFKHWDLGDIVWAKGNVFKTKTGELSVHVEEIKLLTKSLRPLPDKFHGLADKEQRYRQRYVDLIANESSREIFRMRANVIESVRRFFHARRYLEVETPMLQTLAGGAAARPFETYHNALDMPMYLRIAPELFLKRLVVGGFDRVYEINRNFRNEGVSTQHNPEFTMLEFYQAYATYEDLIVLTEDMMRAIAQDVQGSTLVHYQGETFDFGKPFARFTLKESISHFNADIDANMLDTIEEARKVAERLRIEVKPSYGLGKIQTEIFEKAVEHHLIQPTFITQYPAEVSPLARRNDDNPFVTDRFEIFVAGRELGNGFSELNDPDDQAERFQHQMQEKAAGDDEAMPYDEDYIHALEYGMPPTAGEGIGIDRLVMLFTDAPSIRDVILFPHMRPVLDHG